MLLRPLISLFLTISLGACASSETRSDVSAADIPGTKYKKIVVFIENHDPAQPNVGPMLRMSGGMVALVVPAPTGSSTDAEIELSTISALKNAGVDAKSGPALFAGKTLSDQSKAKIVQTQFDAVLYVAVLTNGMREKRLENAFHDGKNITIRGFTDPIDDYTFNHYDLKSDGSVWIRTPTFQAKCDMQDAKTAKLVWSSETTATGATAVLPSTAAQQIVEKMRTDHAI